MLEIVAEQAHICAHLRHDWILVSGAVVGITTTARKPARVAARATPCAWLPAEAAMTPVADALRP